VLTIARGTSNEVVGPTKTGRTRRLTLGPTTAALWRHTVEQWRHRAGEGQRFGPWLFSRRDDHTTRLSTSCLAHWFAELCADAGHPEVPSTVSGTPSPQPLVSQGDILQAQYRLGHRDAATTLRIYSHVLPLTDNEAAATMEALYQP
jgi:integrase